MGDMTDAQLIARACEGRADAFEQLMARHGHVAAGVIRRLVADRHHAEDLFQETLMQCWLRLDQLRDAERFVPWLARIARNEANMHHRKQPREACFHTVPERDRRTGSMGRGTAGGSDDRLEESRAALDALTGPAARSARLFYRDGLSIREICEATGLPTGTVKRQLHQARHRIRQSVQQEPAT